MGPFRRSFSLRHLQADSQGPLQRTGTILLRSVTDYLSPRQLDGPSAISSHSLGFSGRRRSLTSAQDDRKAARARKRAFFGLLGRKTTHGLRRVKLDILVTPFGSLGPRPRFGGGKERGVDRLDALTKTLSHLARRPPSGIIGSKVSSPFCRVARGRRRAAWCRKAQGGTRSESRSSWPGLRDGLDEFPGLEGKGSTRQGETSAALAWTISKRHRHQERTGETRKGHGRRPGGGQSSVVARYCPMGGHGPPPSLVCPCVGDHPVEK